MPTFNGIEDNCINGLGYAVYEGSKNKDEAIKFAIWLTSAEAQKLQGESVPLFPQDLMRRICLQKHILSIIWKLTPTTLILHIRCLSA